MRSLVPVVLILAVAASMPIPGERTDASKFVGSWKVVSLTESGKMVPAEQTAELRVTISADKMVVFEKDKIISELSYQLNPNVMPRAIDLAYSEGKEKPVTKLGIYVFEGEHLKIAVNEKGEARPDSFTGKAVETCSVVVLKRLEKPANP